MSHIDTQHSGCSSGYIDSTGEISIYLYSIEQQRHENDTALIVTVIVKDPVSYTHLDVYKRQLSVP